VEGGEHWSGTCQRYNNNINNEVCQTYYSHGGLNLKTEIVKITIIVPLQHTNTMLDRRNTILWSSDGELNHSSSLIRAQLEVVSLIGAQCGKLHGHVRISAHVNQWKIPELQGNVVGFVEVIIDADIFLGVLVTILELEESVLAVSTALNWRPSELLDGVDLVI
jgi:hypothetical protein